VKRKGRERERKALWKDGLGGLTARGAFLAIHEEVVEEGRKV
jgi:hypothetical protein